MSKRKYYNCSVFGCLNTTFNKNDMTFFTIPTSVERRTEWLKLIHREDLNDKIPSGHYRVCEDHFDIDSILISSKRKVLKQNSVPKLLLPNKKYQTAGCQATIETAQKSTQCDSIKRSVLLQTPKYLSRVNPQKRKPRIDINECLKKLKTTSKVYRSIFFNLCDKFLNKNLAALIKEQIRLKLHSHGNRYSEDYKVFCLNLFYTSPQAYRLLKDTLCLPSKSALQTMNIPVTVKANKQLRFRLKQRKKAQMTDLKSNCSVVEPQSVVGSQVKTDGHEKEVTQ